MGQIFVSTNNSTTVPLLANATFIGRPDSLQSWEEVDINIAGTPTVAPGTLYFEFSPDGTNWDVSIPLYLTGPNTVPTPLRSVLPYFRVRYINGNTDLTMLRLTVVFHRTASTRLTRFLTQPLDVNEPVEVVRVAKLDSGTVAVNNFSVGFNNQDGILTSDRSVFGSGVVANRISQLTADFSGQLTDVFNNDIGQILSGGATFTQINGFATLSSGVGTTASAKLFTNGTLKYYPGREIYAQKTAGFTIPTDINSEQRVGIFDGYNGFFIGYHGTVFGITLRNLSIDTFTPISSFNGDKLDGNANSKFTRNGIPEAVNFTFENIYRTRFGWLGAAPIIFQIMDPDGQWVTFHTIRQPNTSSSPSIANPNLPITFEIEKFGSDATDITITTSSWDAGVVDSPSSPFKVTPTFSLLNSTTAPLVANASFIGSSEDVSGYVSIDVTILSDQTSAVNGLLFEWSQDNITFNYPESFTISANTGSFYSLAPRAKYFRISYTNGITSQTALQLTTVFYPISRSVYVQNLDTDVPSQKAVEVVRSVIAAQKPGGPVSNYTNLQATSSGLLKVSVDTSIFPPIAATTLIQKHNTGPVFATNISTSFISNVHLGNTLIVVVIQGQGTFNETYTLADSLGNIYSKAAGTHNVTPSGSSIDVWYATTTTGACTISANSFYVNTHLAIQAYEVSGLLTAGNPIDKIAASASLGTFLSVGPVVTGSDDEFCVAAYGTDIATVISPGAGWTSDLSVSGFGCFSQIQSSAGSITGTATTSVSVNSIEVLVTFLPSITTKPIQTDQNGRLIVQSGITDYVNGIVAVKPSSTAATSTDTALVVAISPNNPITTTLARPATNTTISVAASTSNVTLLLADSIRLGATIYNDSSAVLYVKLGITASITDFTIRLFPFCYYEVPYGYTGQLDGFWTVAAGFARIGELT